MFTNAGPNVGRKPAQIAKNELLHYKCPSLNTASVAHPSHWQHKIRGTYTVMNNQFTTCKLHHVREHTYTQVRVTWPHRSHVCHVIMLSYTSLTILSRNWYLGHPDECCPNEVISAHLVTMATRQGTEIMTIADYHFSLHADVQVRVSDWLSMANCWDIRQFQK